MTNYTINTPTISIPSDIYGLLGVGTDNTGKLITPESLVTGYVTPSSISTFTNKSGNISQWTNDVGYLTSFTETDPVFSAAPASGIAAGDITNWNSAYGWGDHAAAGYLTSFTETDPVFGASPAAGITAPQISNWNTAYGWGNHAAAGYLDDYEEGTWTPTIEGNSGASGQTYTDQSGHYVKVGRQVTAWFSVTLSNKGTLSGTNLVIAGLPFTMENNFGVGQGVIVFWNDLTANVSSMMLNNFVNEAKAYINHAVGAGNTFAQNNTTIIGTATRLDGMVTYREV